MKVLNYTATAVFVVLVFYLLVVEEALLLPPIIAITIWYLINTLSAAFALIRLSNIRIPGPICLIASICTFAAVIWMLVKFLSGSLAEVMQVIPEYQENLTMRLENLPFVDMLAIQELGLMQSVAEWIDLPAYATSIAASFAGIVANSGLIFIYVLFLFLEQGH
ncbi:MAG: hypothetical protein EXR84_01805 [Gammaproteobacteria bacterium]|nr:hypothetical protein [Gammaproteobacteria bacterium]